MTATPKQKVGTQKGKPMTTKMNSVINQLTTRPTPRPIRLPTPRRSCRPSPLTKLTTIPLQIFENQKGRRTTIPNNKSIFVWGSPRLVGPRQKNRDHDPKQLFVAWGVVKSWVMVGLNVRKLPMSDGSTRRR